MGRVGALQPPQLPRVLLLLALPRRRQGGKGLVSAGKFQAYVGQARGPVVVPVLPLVAFDGLAL